MGKFGSILDDKLQMVPPVPPAQTPATTPDTSVATEDLDSGIPKQEGEERKAPPYIYPTPVQVQESGNGMQFTILLSNAQHPKSQIAIQQLLASATKDDTVILNIAALNGLLYSTLTMAAMLKVCRANTITIFNTIDSIEALILWLAGKERRVAKLPFLSINTLNYGNQGSVPDQIVDAQNTALMQGELLSEIVKAGIMTQAEADEFQKKEDVFVKFGDDLMDRLKSSITSPAV